MPTHGGGNFAVEGRGGLKAWNDDVGMMMRWLAFYMLFTKGIFRELERNTHDFFALLCFEIFALLLSFFVRTLHLTSCISFFEKWNKLRKRFGRLENFSRKFLALSENLGASWELLRQTFALEKNRRTWKLLRQTFALDEKIGGFEIYCAKPLRFMKK